MERLTKKSTTGADRYVSAIGSGHGAWPRIIQRLAAYENTGLAPEEIMAIRIPRCVCCNTRLAVPTSAGLIASSAYIGGPMCHDCQVEHCLATNCYTCELGEYPNCKHQELKKIYMNQED